MPNGKSGSDELVEYFAHCASESDIRAQYKDQLIIIAANLDDLKGQIDKATKVLKDTVKPVARRYTEIATSTLPKLQVSYQKKALASEKENLAFTSSPTGGSSQGQKIYKLQREADLSDLAYRTCIVDLEESRLALDVVKQKACILWEVIEKRRCEVLEQCLDQLAKTLTTFQNLSAQKVESFVACAGHINQVVDCKISMVPFLSL